MASRAALLKVSKLLRNPAGEKVYENAAMNMGRPSRGMGLFGGAVGALGSASLRAVFEGFLAVSPYKTCAERYVFDSDEGGLTRQPLRSKDHLIDHCFDALDSGRLFDLALRIKCISGFVERELLRRKPALQVAQERREVIQAAQAAQSARRGRHEADDFASKGLEAAFPVFRLGLAALRAGFGRAAGPVERVFQEGGVAAVVFGAGDDPARVAVHEAFEGDDSFGGAARLKISVVEGDVQFLQLNQRGPRTGFAHKAGGFFGELAVEGLHARGACEDEDGICRRCHTL
jgi:hypothetical protein